MTAKVTLNDAILKQLQETGELRVESIHGIPLVLMTIDARQQLDQDNDLTDEEQNAVMASALNDPEDWGAPDMDIYDKLYGKFFSPQDAKIS